ncbi:adenosylcobinamide-phosphate synthase CbiB [Halocatena halophila]|uniref:adenosylcobinamide-phosphate synthase CbiB n=1 Tax=Halocatena halophila TaxID=2814576 RepID=UPI002ED24D7A
MSQVWLAVVIAGLLDLAVKEPSNRFHPVAWLGRLIGVFDRSWPAPRYSGIGIAIVIPAVAALCSYVFIDLSGQLYPWLSSVTGGVVLFVSISLRSLIDTARSVVTASETDLVTARTQLRALAGRDPTTLSPGQIRSAAIESAAENLADGWIGPLFAFVCFSPLGVAAAGGAASWMKAVNTLDSMLGYRDRPLGTASARLDDAVQWLPARLTAVALGIDAPSAITTQRTWLSGVPSPNSGWPMGTIAAVTGCKLEKPGVYTLNPTAQLPSGETAQLAIDRVAIRGVWSFLVGIVLVWLGGVVV